MPESTIAFHLGRIREYGLFSSDLLSERDGAEAFQHAGMLLAIMLAGNQEPPYEERLEEHGDAAGPEVLLYPDELGYLTQANQFIALFASGISNRSFRDR